MNIRLHGLELRINGIHVGHGAPRSRERFAYIYGVQNPNEYQLHELELSTNSILKGYDEPRSRERFAYVLYVKCK